MIGLIYARPTGMFMTIDGQLTMRYHLLFIIHRFEPVPPNPCTKRKSIPIPALIFFHTNFIFQSLFRFRLLESIKEHQITSLI